MNPIKNFYITKNKFKKTDKQPDYKISFKAENDEFVEVGSAWIKDGKGGKFFSCKLNDIYVDHVKNTARKGYVLIQEGQTPIAEKYEQVPDEVFQDAQNDPLGDF